MNHILIDGITSITLHNGIVRIECTNVGSDGKQHPSGAVMIPGVVAGQVLQAIVNGMREIEMKLREQQSPAPIPPTAGSA